MNENCANFTVSRESSNGFMKKKVIYFMKEIERRGQIFEQVVTLKKFIIVES